MQIRGAVIIVTGAAGGIGRATAIALATRGAIVIGVDRDADGLASLQALTQGRSMVVDLADPRHADHVVNETLATDLRIDAVIANAGIGYVGDFATMPVDQINRLLDVNLRAPMVLARAALPSMLERGDAAALVFTTSIAGAVPVPGEAAYTLSKTALEAFADAIREDLRGTAVTVSTVRPGVVQTAFHADRTEPYDRRVPRPVPPERIAAAIAAVLEKGDERRTVPRWLGVAGTVHHRLPWLYRPLSRRLG